MVDTNFKKIFLKKNYYDKQNMYTEEPLKTVGKER